MNEECENKKDNKAPISNEIAKRFLDDRKILHSTGIPVTTTT